LDGELKERLAILETLLKGLKELNTIEHKSIRASVDILNNYVNDEITIINKGLKLHGGRISELEKQGMANKIFISALIFIGSIIGSALISQLIGKLIGM